MCLLKDDTGGSVSTFLLPLNGFVGESEGCGGYGVYGVWGIEEGKIPALLLDDIELDSDNDGPWIGVCGTLLSYLYLLAGESCSESRSKRRFSNILAMF